VAIAVSRGDGEPLPADASLVLSAALRSDPLAEAGGVVLVGRSTWTTSAGELYREPIRLVALGEVACGRPVAELLVRVRAAGDGPPVDATRTLHGPPCDGPEVVTAPASVNLDVPVRHGPNWREIVDRLLDPSAPAPRAPRLEQAVSCVEHDPAFELRGVDLRVGLDRHALPTPQAATSPSGPTVSSGAAPSGADDLVLVEEQRRRRRASPPRWVAGGGGGAAQRQERRPRLPTCRHLASERGPQQLRAEADAEHGHPPRRPRGGASSSRIQGSSSGRVTDIGPPNDTTPATPSRCPGTGVAGGEVDAAPRDESAPVVEDLEEAEGPTSGWCSRTSSSVTVAPGGRRRESAREERDGGDVADQQQRALPPDDPLARDHEHGGADRDDHHQQRREADDGGVVERAGSGEDRRRRRPRRR
jgi:hypothetical protein